MNGGSGAAGQPREQRRRVGVIVVPRYFDTTSRELLDIAPNVDVLHTQMRLDGDFEFTMPEIIAAADEIRACARSLAEAGAEVVVQLGTPFSTAHGWDAGRALQDSIEADAGVPFEMMGLSVPSGVLALGHRRVALATTYYGPEWADRYRNFAQEAGLEVVGAQSFVDQGRFETHEASWAASFETFEPSFVCSSIEETARRSPSAEAILVPGLPGRLLGEVAELEAAIDRPVVSYFAIWWRCLLRLGERPLDGSGQLLTSMPAGTY